MAKEQKLRANGYIVFDFETGGRLKDQDMDPKKGLVNPVAFPVTDFGCIVLKGDDLSEVLRYDSMLKPYDQAHIYDPEAAAITGITKQDVVREGITLEEFKEDLLQIFAEANRASSKFFKAVLIGHNLRFDIPFLQDIALRTGIDLSKHLDGDYDRYGKFQPRYLDTEKLSLMAWGHLPQRNFNLASCVDKAGLEIVGAHRALPDVVATTELFRHITRVMRGSYNIEEGSQISEQNRKTFQF